ncbi:3'-5' exonuclease [Hymenobacter nivis]|uniref:Exonuclease domain-containing protein n=1 Tax=Hymenobacter nivis TaxID=1850093 RepID=A0A2Z3GPL9_9BACT|nr:3'-5' exonuclease [Hymenobacter nivis]AWM31334.1 hypothetical protein DDQ68_00160 [Hymenobacter nivis]
MPNYYLRTTGMSRSITDGTSKKNACTWHREYFRLTDEGLLSSVHEYEDGFYYLSAPALLPVPQAFPLPVPCPAALFHDAHARCVAYLREQEAKRYQAAAFARSLKYGMAVRAHAAKEAGAAEPLMLAEASHWLDDFTVFDVETTGTDATRNHLLELAAVRYVAWTPVAELQLFVRCPIPVPPFITNLTGITTAQVARAPEPKHVLQQFKKLAGDSVLVGHNVGFDLRFVNAARAALGAPEPLANPFLDTLVLAAHWLPAPHKLGDLCQRFGIRTAGAHRALADVRMTFALLRHLHQLEAVPASFRNATGKPSKRAAKPVASLFEAA